MIRAVCITFFVLNTFPKDIPSNLCKAQESKHVDIGKVLRKLKQYIGSVPNIVGMDRWFKGKTKQSFRDDFLRNIEKGLNAIKPSGRKEDRPEMKPMIRFRAPVRKYKHTISGKSAIKLIRAHGYKAETHKIVTFDGYTLTVQRILPGGRPPTNESVILHHGLLGSSEDWLLLGLGKALPYLLADHGYDVWLVNARGNKYSVAHEDMDVDSFDFWDFSWHEMGTYDLPAIFTYISHYTRGANLYYIGHSMGGTALLVLLSTYPEYNQKIKLAFLLAPLAFMGHVKGPLKYYVDNYRSEIYYDSENKRKEFTVNYTLPQAIIDRYCIGSSKTCSNALLLLATGGKNIPDPEMCHKILSHVPAGGSSKTMVHYLQLIKSGNFQMFDYGTLVNLKYYKNEYPPAYNLSAIKLPITLFSSPSDWLSTEADIIILLSKLSTVRSYDTPDNFDHLDFVWSNEAAYMVYYIMIDILDDFTRKRVNTLFTTMI